MFHTPNSARIGTAAGLTTGMRVDTSWGWRSAEAIQAGDRIHTLNGAECCVRSVETTVYGADLAEQCPQGLVLVPGGALDNCEAFYLFPEAHILLTGTAVDALSGDGAALVRAADLVGYLGIIRALPVDGIKAIRLVFDEEEVIFANSGVLIHCPVEPPETRCVSALFEVLDTEGVRVLMSCRSFAERPVAAQTGKSGAAA